MKRLIPMTCLLICSCAIAQVSVMRVGQTVDVSTLIQRMMDSSAQDMTQEAGPPDSVDLNSFYNVRTSTLSPDNAASTITENNITQPLFIVGDDALSINWMKKNARELTQLNAAGFLVNCSGQAEFDAISNATRLPLTPINGDDFAELFHIKNYPVLITRASINNDNK